MLDDMNDNARMEEAVKSPSIFIARVTAAFLTARKNRHWRL